MAPAYGTSTPRGCDDCGDMVPPIGGIEPARLLGNEARATLLAAGLSEELIVRLADDFIAEHRMGELEEFIAWAEHCAQVLGQSAPQQ